jgi:uncharacterized protein DUF4388
VQAMSIWLVIGAVVVVALVALVVFGTRRPRRAEDELGQATPMATPTPTSALPTAPANQVSVRALLASFQTQRMTGMVQLTSGEQHCLVYFLFGHAFHAASGTLTGEAALQQAATWHDVRYAFDNQAPLPAQETIKRPIDQILAA